MGGIFYAKTRQGLFIRTANPGEADQREIIPHDHTERFIKAREQAKHSSVTVCNMCSISGEALTAYEAGKQITRDSVKAALADPYQIPIIEQFSPIDT